MNSISSFWLKNTMMTIYMASIILMLNLSSIIMFWLMLELNMVMFILIMANEQSYTSKNEVYHQCLFYFMIQSLGSVLFLMASIFITSNAQEFKELMILMAITLKAGMIPLEIWLYKIMELMSKKMFLLLITIQKIPMFIIMTNAQSTLIIFLLLSNTVIGSYYLWKSTNIKQILISSSIYTTMWLILAIWINMISFLMIFVKYTIIVSMLTKNVDVNLKSMNFTMKFMIIICMIFLLGIPPMDLFFFKIYTLKILTEYKMWLIMTILWLATFVSTMAYSMKLINFSKMNSLLYHNKTSENLKKSMIVPFTMLIMYI